MVFEKYFLDETNLLCGIDFFFLVPEAVVILRPFDIQNPAYFAYAILS